MGNNKTKKQSDKDTLAEVTKEMAKPRVAMSARERDTDENDSGRPTDDPKELLRQKVAKELAAPSQASTGMSPTPNVNICLKTLGLKSNADSLAASRHSIRF
jgi:hypothetical protein